MAGERAGLAETEFIKRLLSLLDQAIMFDTYITRSEQGTTDDEETNTFQQQENY